MLSIALLSNYPTRTPRFMREDHSCCQRGLMLWEQPSDSAGLYFENSFRHLQYRFKGGCFGNSQPTMKTRKNMEKLYRKTRQNSKLFLYIYILFRYIQKNLSPEFEHLGLGSPLDASECAILENETAILAYPVIGLLFPLKRNALKESYSYEPFVYATATSSTYFWDLVGDHVLSICVPMFIMFLRFLEPG